MTRRQGIADRGRVQWLWLKLKAIGRKPINIFDSTRSAAGEIPEADGDAAAITKRTARS